MSCVCNAVDGMPRAELARVPVHLPKEALSQTQIPSAVSQSPGDFSDVFRSNALYRSHPIRESVL